MITKATGMHFSRMRTARLLPVSPSMHCSGGVPDRGVGVPAPEEGGGPGLGGVPGPRGLYLVQEGTWSRGVPGLGVYLVLGV